VNELEPPPGLCDRVFEAERLVFAEGEGNVPKSVEC